MIYSVIFDWGGVLIEEPTLKTARRLSQFVNIPVGALIPRYERLKKDFQKGLITEKDLWKNAGINLPEDRSYWKEAFAYAYEPKEEMFSLVRQLKERRYSTAILSNTEPPAVQLFREQKYNCFDVEVFSCDPEIKSIKPDEKIYFQALERLNSRPHEAVFIDDRIENVKAAEDLGMRGVLYRNSGQTIEEIKSLCSNLF